MRGAFAGIAGLLLLGFLLSLYLILSPEDYALMLLKGKKYSQAQLYYQNKYAEGARSADIAIPLQTIEIAAGDNDKAIHVMEEYVRQHPNDIHARKLLGELYLNSYRRVDYLRNLEILSKQDPSIEN